MNWEIISSEYYRYDLILLCLSAFICILISMFFIFKAKKGALSYIGAIFKMLLLIWVVCKILELCAATKEIKWVVICFENIGCCFVGYFWFVLSSVYLDGAIWRKYRTIVKRLFVLPVVFYLIVLTNNFHYLFFSQYEHNKISFGKAFWAHTIVSYLFIIIGTSNIIRYSMKQFGLSKVRSYLLILAAIFPLTVNVLHITGIVQFKIDMTPITLVFTTAVIFLISSKYNYLNILPIALRRIFNNMKESIVVVDYYNKIIDYNSSFYSLCSQYTPIAYNDYVSVFFNSLKTNIEDSSSIDNIIKQMHDITMEITNVELVVLNPSKTYYSISINPIMNRKNEPIGRIITISDISDYKHLMEELRHKNLDLLESNIKLKEYAASAKEVAVIKERNRFSLELHDTLGHTLTLILKLQQAGLISLHSNPDRTRDFLNQTVSITKEGITDLKRSISGLMPKKVESNELVAALKELCLDFKGLGITTNLVARGSTNYDSYEHSEVIFKTCREALTNSLRHGNADKLNIVLYFSPEKIKLSIMDNGKGCKNIKKGLGLKGMGERIKKIGGKISYYSNGKAGFAIRAVIPVNNRNYPLMFTNNTKDLNWRAL
ncbi:MAG: histidine kinase [Clostridia bacterium]|nr:histidine kinase [Clostridia bacterium]